MNRKLIVKISIDICMTISLLLLMSYSLIGEVLHEWIGMAIFILFIVHHILNRKWITTIVKGRYTLIRIIQIVLVLAMIILMTGSMVSGILLSNHLFKAVKIGGISMEARQIHMFCAYWGFVIMSFHLGIHWNIVIIMMGRLFKKPSMIRMWIARLVAFILATYGLHSFFKRHIGGYLLMKIHFVFYDYSENIMSFLLDYLTIMFLMAFIGYYISKYARSTNL